MQLIKYKKQKIIIAIVYLIVVALFYFFDWPCVFVKMFGICCPGCGMTRAWLSVLQFDFISAFKFHPMFFTIPVIAFYLVFDGAFAKNKKLNYMILSLIAFGFIINWIFKLFL